MKIDLPIVILFDCQATDFRSVERAAGKFVGTLRFDTEDEDSAVFLFLSYPPRDGEVEMEERYAENGGPILANIPAAAYREVKKRAERNPYDYMTGTEEERTAAQEKVDAGKEPRL